MNHHDNLFLKAVISFFLILIMLFPIFVEVLFALKYSHDFAIQTLELRGFEHVEILDDTLASDRLGIVANKHVFSFQAERKSQKIQGNLVCYRTFFDLKNSRCEFLADFR